MTTRERKEYRIQQRLQWAASRDAKSAAGFAKAESIASNIPLGQPILVGHHSEAHHRRDIARIDSGMRQGVESAKMADHHRSTADGIQAQLDSSIYSDDSDAVEQLKSRIAEREAARERIKAYNASCRKGTPDSTLLSEEQQKDLLSTAKACPYFMGPKGQFPSYVLANLNGNIKRDRDRLAQIERQNATKAEAESAPNGVTVKRHESYNIAIVTFAEKPSRDILDALRGAGYRWNKTSWQGNLDQLPQVVSDLVK